MCRGLLEQSPALTSAPCFKSNLKHPRLPLFAAQCSGVTFLLASHASICAPWSIKSLTHSSLPAQAARCSADLFVDKRVLNSVDFGYILTCPGSLTSVDLVHVLVRIWFHVRCQSMRKGVGLFLNRSHLKMNLGLSACPVFLRNEVGSSPHKSNIK